MVSLVHNHDFDPGCLEFREQDGSLTGECLIWDQERLDALRKKLSGVPEISKVEEALANALEEIREMMMGRHEKYGPGNIAKHGPTGILVRMDDKFARLEAGNVNYDDETVENTLDDIIGYALIWKLWLRGQWPGSEQ